MSRNKLCDSPTLRFVAAKGLARSPGEAVQALGDGGFGGRVVPLFDAKQGVSHVGGAVMIEDMDVVESDVAV